MYALSSIAWLVLGGFLEPVWLIALKKSDNFKNIPYAIVAVAVMIASPCCVAMAMDTIPMGIAYAVWTGMGAVFAICSSILLMKEKITRMTLMYAAMIMIGAIGLAALGGE
ncbi:MAG: SMR family transporter [archaeon]|nr:SMR family transporter [archaeon]